MNDNLKVADRNEITIKRSIILPNPVLADQNLGISIAMTQNPIIRKANGFQIAYKASHFLDFTPSMQVLEYQ